MHDGRAEHDTAAYSMGIGSCWIGLLISIANDPKVKKELSIPDDHEVYSELIFGIPKGKTSSSLRRPPQILKRID
ncbi:MAG: nitroreductase family protein [Candidatus Bathyarchaeia archaeon]